MLRSLRVLRPVSPFENLCRYVPPSSLSRLRADSLKLDYNEASISAHPAVSKALDDYISEKKLFLYPNLDASELKDMLMDYLKLNESDCDVVVTSGSDEALRILFAAFPGVVFVPQPTYPQIEMFGNKIHYWEPPGEAFSYLENTDLRNFQHCDEIFRTSLIAAASPLSPSIVYLISPNNPNGHELSEISIFEISAAFPDSLIILDQAYHEFSEYPICLLQRLPKNVVVVRTFSKCLGLASLRLGYFLGQREIISGPKNISNSKAVNTAAQVAGISVLKNMQFYLDYAENVKVARLMLSKHLRGRSVNLIVGGGNFLCIRACSVSTVVKLLEQKHGIFVRDISARFPDYFRVTVPGNMQQNVRLIAALDDVLGVYSDIFSVSCLVGPNMTEYRGCAWRHEASQPTVVLSGNCDEWKSHARGALNLSRNGRLLVTLDQTVRDIVGMNFVASSNVIQAEQVSWKEIATIGASDTVSLYNNSGVLLHEAKLRQDERTTCLDISDDGKYIGVGCVGGSVYIANTENYDFRLITSHNAPVRRIRIITSQVHEGIVSISGCDLGNINTVVVKKNEHVTVHSCHHARVTGIEGRNDRFLTAAMDGKIFLFELSRPPCRMIHMQFPIFGLALSPDGSRLFVCGPDLSQRCILHAEASLGGVFEVIQPPVEEDDDFAVETPPIEHETNNQEDKHDEETMKMLYGDF
ncbi:hypothetical protein C9890_0281 [Perkinsus sp. BL_2016]|nr:hypothetical protein C9890_0281 [Perkinsus sp. BL_2016]